MDYDPVKDRLGDFFGRTPLRQRLFFRILGLVFLRNWYVRREIRRTFSSPGLASAGSVRVLDAGTGFGQYAYWIAKSYPTAAVVAVDVKEDYLERAKRFVQRIGLADRVSFAMDDLTRLEASGPFDLILSVDVMEHIEDDRAVFKNFFRVLSDDGVVIINTPSDLGGSGITGEGDESFIGEHVRDGYAVNEITDKLREAGFGWTTAEYSYGRWGSIAWRLLVKYPIRMLGASRWLALVLPLYYLPVLPVGLALNAIDLAIDNAEGTGLLVTARKHAPGRSSRATP